LSQQYPVLFPLLAIVVLAALAFGFVVARRVRFADRLSSAADSSTW
jgi:hypothetical protein